MKPKHRVAWSIPRLAAPLSLFSAFAQMSTETGWEKLAPADEEFSAQIPGKPEISIEKTHYDQITMASTYYTLATAEGPFFMMGSVSGMESFFALISTQERIMAAADDFRENFLKTGSGTDASADPGRGAKR